MWICYAPMFSPTRMKSTILTNTSSSCFVAPQGISQRRRLAQKCLVASRCSSLWTGSHIRGHLCHVSYIHACLPSESFASVGTKPQCISHQRRLALCRFDFRGGPFGSHCPKPNNLLIHQKWYFVESEFDQRHL